MNRRAVLALTIFSSLLASCGFRFRGTTAFSFDTIYIDSPAQSSLAAQLKQQITALGTSGAVTKILPSAQGAKLILRIVRELREKEVTGITASGKQRDYQLRLRVSYQTLKPSSDAPSNEIELILRRDISTLDSQLSSKQEEDILIYREMQNDMVAQLLSRLAAIKP
jgi:LPS-assembly lipoprotein